MIEMEYTIYIREFDKGIGSNMYRENFVEVVPLKGVQKEDRCTSRTDLYTMFLPSIFFFLSFSTGDFSIFH